MGHSSPCPCREGPAEGSPPVSLVSPRDPPGAPRTSASPRCTRRAGSAAKPVTWERGWCSPAGSTRPSASPAWTVSTRRPPRSTWGAARGCEGGLGTTSISRYFSASSFPPGSVAWAHFVPFASISGAALAQVSSTSHAPSLRRHRGHVQRSPANPSRGCSIFSCFRARGDRRSPFQHCSPPDATGRCLSQATGSWPAFASKKSPSPG